MQKKKSVLKLSLLLVPLLVVLVMPGQGLALPITQTVIYENAMLGVPMARVDVAMYAPEETDDINFDWIDDLGSDDYLYLYTLTNINGPYRGRIPVNLIRFGMDFSKDTPINSYGSSLAGVKFDYLLDEDDMIISNFSLSLGNSFSFYLASHLPEEYRPSTVRANFGFSAGAPQLLVPDPDPVVQGIPEPASLLLLGVGLVAIASLRKRIRILKN
jgi:hypothetical protein